MRLVLLIPRSKIGPNAAGENGFEIFEHAGLSTQAFTSSTKRTSGYHQAIDMIQVGMRNKKRAAHYA
jgi:hypothetical protein